MDDKRLYAPEILYGDVILRGGKALRPVPGNSGMLLHEIGWTLMGVTSLVKRLRLAGPMIIWRWKKADMPCTQLAGRMIFDWRQVAAWLERNGYDMAKLEAGKGPAKSRIRTGEHRWRRGQFSPKKPAKTRK
jgi:hypothetical protein